VLEGPTSNACEAQALLVAMQWVVKNVDSSTYDCIVVKGDSRLIINFGNGSYKPKVDSLYRTITEVRDLAQGMRKRLHFMHVPRDDNSL